jgi:HK97 gp10 family phage protein
MALLEIRGVDEIARAFRELPKTAAKKVIRQGVRAAARVALAQARTTVPVRTGALKRDLKVRAAPEKLRRRGIIALDVLMGEGDYKGRSFYGSFVEYGTIEQPPQRFMERALTASEGPARARAAAVIREGIPKEAARLAAKARAKAKGG